MTLECNARSAGAALDEASAHVGSEADVATLVRAALACDGGPSAQDDDAPDQLARKALVQLGFAPAVAARAVEQAAAHVGSEVDLAGWIEEALRWSRPVDPRSESFFTSCRPSHAMRNHGAGSRRIEATTRGGERAS